MSGLIQILIKLITKISIFIKEHIPSKIVSYNFKFNLNVFEKNYPHVKL